MRFVPRKWQEPIIKFVLGNRRVNIWASMGSGKTAAMLTALATLELAGAKDVFPTLVIAPKRVARSVWPDEKDKWDHTRHFRVSVIGGSEKNRRRQLHKPADIYTINYENIPWLIEQCGKTWKFPFVICDESTRLKGFRIRAGTKRAAALARITRKAKRWVNLTGTPAPNGLKDLWGQNYFVDFGKRLGTTWTGFKDRWFKTDPYTMKVEPQSWAHDEIHKRLRDNTLTIEMKDYVDLKKPIVNKVYVDLEPKVMAQYREFEKQMFLELEGDVELTAVSAAAKSIKCLQFASGAVYYTIERDWTVVHDAKLDALESIIEETAGANLMVSYYWKHDLARIKKRFRHARVLDTTQDEDDWNAGKIPLLLVHPASAGHGLNLQHGGHHIVYFSDWWNHENRAQVLERIGPVRQLQSGYDRPVYVYEILARNTTDEDVALSHVSKASVQDALKNAMKRRHQ